MAKIYLDMDGVLADFDAGARTILDTDNTYKWEFVHGANEFWRRLNAYSNFFGALPLMPGARDLVQAIVTAGRAPVILTALPKKDDVDVASQKKQWIARHFGPFEVITCMTDEKPRYCDRGDVLVDDRAVNRHAWEAKGGTFILHTSAEISIMKLSGLGYL